MVDCIEETGKVLNINNQGIVKYLCGIEDERNNLDIIIKKQYEERNQIESEIETLTYKLCLINKSLAMRIKTKNNYDKTIEEIKAHYEQLVDSSNKLRQIVEKTQVDLDSIMNKKVGTAANKSPNDPDDCPCDVPEEPTKEEWSRDAPAKWNSIIKMSQEMTKPANNKDGRRMTNNGIKTFEMKAVEEERAPCDNTSDKVHGSAGRATGSISGSISDDVKKGSCNNTSDKVHGSAKRATCSSAGSISEVKKASCDNNSGKNHGSVEKASGSTAGSISTQGTFLTQEIEFYNVKASPSDLTTSEENKSNSLGRF